MCSSMPHMTAAVRSATALPIVGRSATRSRFQRLACWPMCTSSVRAKPVRRPPRYPRSLPIQMASTDSSVARRSMAESAAARRRGASRRSWTSHRSEYGLKQSSNCSEATASTNGWIFIFQTQVSLLQKAHCVGGFLRREAKAEGAGGHFWHDAVTKPNIITPAP